MIPSMPAGKMTNSKDGILGSLFSGKLAKGNNGKEKILFGMSAFSMHLPVLNKESMVKVAGMKGHNEKSIIKVPGIKGHNEKSIIKVAGMKGHNEKSMIKVPGMKGHGIMKDAAFSPKMAKMASKEIIGAKDGISPRSDGKNVSPLVVDNWEGIKKDVANLLKGHGVEKGEAERILSLIEDKFSPKLEPKGLDVIKNGISRGQAKQPDAKPPPALVMNNLENIKKDIANLLKSHGVEDGKVKKILSAFSSKIGSKKGDVKGKISPELAGPSDNKDKPEIFAPRELKLGDAVKEKMVENLKIIPEKDGLSTKNENIIVKGHGNVGSIDGGAKVIKAESSASHIRPSIMINQIADGAVNVLKKGPGRVKIQLYPPRLGALNMDVSIQNNKVRVVLMVENHEARHVLQSNIEQIRSSLQGQGLHVDSFDVLVQERAGKGGPGFGQGETLSGEGKGNRGGGDEENTGRHSQFSDMSSDENGAGLISVFA